MDDKLLEEKRSLYSLLLQLNENAISDNDADILFSLSKDS